MNIIRYLLLVAALFGLAGCTNSDLSRKVVESMTSDEFLAYSGECDTMPSCLLDTVFWIPLENSEVSAFNEISKLSVGANRVIVWDKRQGSIYSYEFPSGKLQYVIDKKGQGKGEYLETAAVTVTETSVYVLDNFSHSVLRYSSDDGSFVEKKPISFVAWDMEAYDDEAFLFTWLSNNPEAVKPPEAIDYAVWRTDGDFNIVETYLPVEEDYVEPYGKTIYFTRQGDDIIFHALKYDGYFRFGKNGRPQFFPIEFSNPTPKDRPLRLKDLENTSWQYLGETPFVSDDFAVVEISEGEYGQQMFASSGKVFGNSRSWARNIPVGIVGVTKGNEFIGYVNDNIDQYRQLIDYGFQKGTASVDSLLEQGGCSLIVYKLGEDFTINSKGEILSLRDTKDEAYLMRSTVSLYDYVSER